MPGSSVMSFDDVTVVDGACNVVTGYVYVAGVAPDGDFGDGGGVITNGGIRVAGKLNLSWKMVLLARGTVLVGGTVNVAGASCLKMGIVLAGTSRVMGASWLAPGTVLAGTPRVMGASWLAPGTVLAGTPRVMGASWLAPGTVLGGTPRVMGASWLALGTVLASVGCLEAFPLVGDTPLCPLFAPADAFDNCSWRNIIWFPSLIARVSGDFPLRKSFTWKYIDVYKVTGHEQLLENIKFSEDIFSMAQSDRVP